MIFAILCFYYDGYFISDYVRDVCQQLSIFASVEQKKLHLDYIL